MFLSLLMATMLHPVHETVSEVQWNGETKRVEVALRMSVLDQEWIQRNHAKPDEAIKRWATKYLAQTFLVDPTKDKDNDNDNDAKPAKYHWVGHKDEGAHVWWYFEIQPVDHKKPIVVSQRMFFKRDQGYANRLLILGDAPRDQVGATQASPRNNTPVPRRSVTLTIQQPTTKLDVKADDDRSTEPNSNAPPRL